MNWKPLLALIAPLLTTACGTGVSDVKPTCPPLKAYSADQQTAVLLEKSAAEKAGATWPAWIDDYGRLRAECRALQ